MANEAGVGGFGLIVVPTRRGAVLQTKPVDRIMFGSNVHMLGVFTPRSAIRVRHVIKPGRSVFVELLLVIG